MLVPLFTRFKREDVLNNFTRGRIFQCIHDNPCISFGDIRKKIGISNSTLVYHLDLMEREKYVTSRHDGRHKYYHIHPSRNGASASAVNGAMEQVVPDIERRIIEAIRKKPGISQKEIASLIGESRRAVNYHVKILLEGGSISVNRKLGRTECFLCGISPSEASSDASSA